MFEKIAVRDTVVVMLAFLASLTGCAPLSTTPSLYDVGVPLESRSITAENPTGARGEGGRAASALGVGRKGSPNIYIQPGQTVQICDIEGPGVIRHIWMTQAQTPQVLQGLVLRAYWDHQPHPSIEVPIGPFFGVMHGKVSAYESAVHSVNAKAGFNNWMPMPFRKNARIELTNESNQLTPVFFSIDYTLGDELPEETGCLHALYRRENPTTLGRDFEILPRRQGKGRFLGCLIGIRTLSENWWGEGEIKFYLDGDREYPTICGTGTEDYVGQSWGLQDAAYLFMGTSLHPGSDWKAGEFNTIYRWHIPDPIYWKEDIRITIQQIGHNTKALYERQDDWSACAFWYEALESAPLPHATRYLDRVKDGIQ